MCKIVWGVVCMCIYIYMDMYPHSCREGNLQSTAFSPIVCSRVRLAWKC